MTSAFTSLAAPALEDTMEVSSSPAGNVFDGDIDIDYDDYPTGVHLTDDECMLEDGDPTRPPTATDEMMDDDDHTTTLVEEVMQDDPQHDQPAHPEPADEELIDYDDESYQDVNQSFFDDTTLQNTETSFMAPNEAVTESEQIDEEVVREPELFTEEQANLEEPHVPPAENVETAAPKAPVHEEQASQTGLQIEIVAPALQEQSSGTVEDATADGDDAADAGEDLLEESAAAVVEPEQDENTASLKPLPQFAGSLDTTARNVPDGPPTPTDTGLHPITINYRDYSMPMFKSSRQPDGLLKNDNLASIGLSNLMQDCKDRLKTKLGEEIPEDHELVLGFNRMGLMLVEVRYSPFPAGWHPLTFSQGNTSTFDTSLNDIIEIWQQLHYNDGFADEDVPALSVTLTSQPKFSASVGMLQKAVNEGQGISSFAPTYLAEKENYAYEDEEAQAADEHPAQEGQELAAGEEEQYDEHAYAQEDANEQDQHQDNSGNEYQEEPTEESNGEDQAEHYPEDGHEDEINYADFDPNEEYPDPEDFDQNESTGANAETFDAPPEQTHEKSEEQTQSKGDQIVEALKPDSAASSTTVRGDTANDNTGEYYDEDLIDWDDDEFLTGSSETDADHGQDDFSTLLNDYEAVPGQAGAEDVHTSKVVEKAHDEAPAENEAKSHPSEDHQEEQANFGLESEDFLGEDSTTQPVPQAAEQYQDNPEEDLIEYEDEAFNEADLIDYDHRDEDQPDEDDEQFHTALDLLEGDDTEHGPETVDATVPDKQPQQPAADEDNIGFEDDDYPEPEPTAQGSTNSPLGKRSFEEHADDDDLLNFDEEPELKKARSD